MVAVSAQAVGLDETVALLDGMVSRTSDLRPAWRGIAQDMRQRERELFEAGGRGLWAPLKASTVRRKGGQGRLLVDTGGLLASLTRRGDQYAVEDITETSLVFGTRNPVSNLLRRGVRGAVSRDPLPAFQAPEREFWAQELLDHVTGGR